MTGKIINNSRAVDIHPGITVFINDNTISILNGFFHMSAINHIQEPFRACEQFA